MTLDEQLATTVLLARLQRTVLILEKQLTDMQAKLDEFTKDTKDTKGADR